MTELVQKTYDHMQKSQLGEATGHDWWHSKRVYEMAVYLAEGRADLDHQVVELAALLHDIADWKFNGGDEGAGPRAAREWLESIGAEEKLILHVEEIIYDLSFKGNKEQKAMATPEGEVVQDADRLDAMGAIGIARTFAFGALALQNQIVDPAILPRKALDSAGYKDRNVRSTTVNHFFEKLLLLKDRINTEKAKAVAEKRHGYMVAYLEELFFECGLEETALAKELVPYQ